MTDDLIDADSIEAADEKFFMRPWPHPAGEPMIIAKAKGCTIWDVHGKEYLDLTAGYFVNTAGHCHPKIIEAVGGRAPPQKWWDRVERARKERGILLIADEVQTGLGRTGKMFAVEPV